jgi:hypothetical protein
MADGDSADIVVLRDWLACMGSIASPRYFPVADGCDLRIHRNSHKLGFLAATCAGQRIAVKRVHGEPKLNNEQRLTYFGR